MITTALHLILYYFFFSLFHVIIPRSRAIWRGAGCTVRYRFNWIGFCLFAVAAASGFRFQSVFFFLSSVKRETNNFEPNFGLISERKSKQHSEMIGNSTLATPFWRHMCVCVGVWAPDFPPFKPIQLMHFVRFVCVKWGRKWSRKFHSCLKKNLMDNKKNGNFRKPQNIINKEIYLSVIVQQLH